MIRCCNESLKRLKIKVLDIYQVHWPNPVIPLKDHSCLGISSPMPEAKRSTFIIVIKIIKRFITGISMMQSKL